VENVSRALEAVRNEEAFDLVILDINMLGMEGLTGARQMVDVCKAPVVLMSGSAKPQDVQAAMDLGVKGFIPKTLAGKALINAVRLVAAGETYVPSQYLQPGADDSDASLTPRELQVLAQLRHGTGNKEIARVLSITETTVKLHLRSIAEKLGAKNRVDIAVKAIDRGLM
ncbi:MAG: response regulator transcription factor, partial [Parvularculaceae bacterium]|nr:response regulator transcription factor [Parvularculaceae bacterium]